MAAGITLEGRPYGTGQWEAYLPGAGGGTPDPYGGKAGGARETLQRVTRADYMRFKDEFAGFEDDLFGRLDSTDLIDAAPENIRMGQETARGIASRAASRYGIGFDPSAQTARTRSRGLGDVLGQVQGMSDARVAQEDLNRATLGGLLNIGAGLNQASLTGLQQAAALEQQEENFRYQRKLQRQQKRRGIMKWL